MVFVISCENELVNFMKLSTCIMDSGVTSVYFRTVRG